MKTFLALIGAVVLGIAMFSGHSNSSSTAADAAAVATAAPIVLTPAASIALPVAVPAAATPTVDEVQAVVQLALADYARTVTSCYGTGGSISSPACLSDMAALKKDAGLASDDLDKMPANPVWGAFILNTTVAMSNLAAIGDVCPAGPSHDAVMCLTFQHQAQTSINDALAAIPA